MEFLKKIDLPPRPPSPLERVGETKRIEVVERLARLIAKAAMPVPSMPATKEASDE